MNNSTTTSSSTKLPRSLLDSVFAFAPNRDTLGATAYFIVEKEGNLLVDCPAWEQTNQDFLQQQGGVRWLFLTHRGAISQKVKQIHENLGCEVIIQEQEAYLLPEIPVTTFKQELNLNNQFQAIWTPGFSPGSACLYYRQHGGILFTGRHLLPNQKGEILPLRTAKTFHWWRQLDSVAKLRDRFTPEILNYLIPAANTGFLRGKGMVDHAYKHLENLDLVSLRAGSSFLT